MRFRAFDVVSFDASGTLIAPRAVGQVYSEVLHDFGIAADAEVLSNRFANAFRDISAEERSPDDVRDMDTFWRLVVRRTVCPDPLPAKYLDAFFERIFATFAERRCWRALPGAATVLQGIRARGYRVVVLSNADTRYRRIFRELGLSRFVDAFFLSGEIGFEKPDPRLFRHVEKTMGAAPDRILHVGDSLRNDVHGARRAGWSCFHVQPPLRKLTDLFLLRE